jgi:hypothetical protein
MSWMNFLAIVLATWCGVDVGIAITKKDYKEIAFNAVLILFEWCYVLFNWGV